MSRFLNIRCPQEMMVDDHVSHLDMSCWVPIGTPSTHKKKEKQTVFYPIV